jgi:hypothetical protein
MLLVVVWWWWLHREALVSCAFGVGQQRQAAVSTVRMHMHAAAVLATSAAVDCQLA